MEPYGYCQCGCGQQTKIAKYTDPHNKRIAGEPYKYIYGHQNDRFRIEPEWLKQDRGYKTKCWIWQLRTTSKGYGRWGRAVAHKRIWEREHGPVPDGCELHHKCEQRDCVNPTHLESVRPVENIRKGKGTKLTAAKVREIRATAAEYPRGRVPNKALGRRYGVSEGTIYAIIKRRLWADV